MATSSRPRPSTASSRPSRGPTALPPYQPLSSPLNQNAINALHSFTRTYPLDGLTKRQAVAISSLQNIAGDVNDRYSHRSTIHQRQTAKRAERGAEEDEAMAQKMEKMRQDTKDLTSKMDFAIRGVIDSKTHVQAIETALRELDTSVREGGGRLPPTQNTLAASQNHTQQRRTQNPSNNSSELLLSDDSDAPTASTQREGPTAFLTRKLALSATDYANLSLKNKYASHNDYISFRNVVHDAQHPGPDAPPLPHASTWFSNPSSTSPHSASPASDSDSDADLQIASEKRSIRCPITLLTMKQPLTSTKCPHSFEKDAILSMLAASSLTVDGGREKAVRCPECEIVLTKGNLVMDAAMVRKIRRILQSEAREAEGEEDEDDMEVGNGRQQQQQQRVSSSPVLGREKAGKRVKREVGESQIREREGEKEVSMVPGTQLAGDGEGEREEESFEMVGETQIEGSEGEGEGETGVLSVDEEEEEEEEEA